MPNLKLNPEFHNIQSRTKIDDNIEKFSDIWISSLHINKVKLFRNRRTRLNKLIGLYQRVLRILSSRLRRRNRTPSFTICTHSSVFFFPQSKRSCFELLANTENNMEKLRSRGEKLKCANSVCKIDFECFEKIIWFFLKRRIIIESSFAQCTLWKCSFLISYVSFTTFMNFY